jgi:hypothetical protein
VLVQGYTKVMYNSFRIRKRFLISLRSIRNDGNSRDRATEAAAAALEPPPLLPPFSKAHTVIDFVFLLRVSAIRASSIALNLASVPTKGEIYKDEF